MISIAPDQFESELGSAFNTDLYFCYQVIIAQWLAWQLAIGQLTIGGVLGSNLSKGDNLVEF